MSFPLSSFPSSDNFCSILSLYFCRSSLFSSSSSYYSNSSALHTSTTTMSKPHQQPQPQGDEDHLAVPQPPTQAHMVNSASVDRNLLFQPQQDIPRGRTTSFFTPPKIANHNRSNPGSRATSRSRTSRPSSRPGSRPVSWLVHANSDYTSMYENFGGTRSRRTSFVGADDSAAEKGVISRASSFVDGADSNEKLARPAMGSRVATYIQEDGSIASEEPPVKGTVSALKASLLLGKAFVGTGVLFLPNAFKNGGKVVARSRKAIPYMIIVTVSYSVSDHIIVFSHFRHPVLVLDSGSRSCHLLFRILAVGQGPVSGP